MLAFKKEIYEIETKSLSKTDVNNYCNRVLKENYPWLKEIDKFALTNSIYDLDIAYQNFFREIKRVIKSRFPLNLNLNEIIIIHIKPILQTII